MKICKNCGAEIQDGAAFCTRCGTKVEEAESGRTEVEPEKNRTDSINRQNLNRRLVSRRLKVRMPEHRM